MCHGVGIGPKVGRLGGVGSAAFHAFGNRCEQGIIVMSQAGQLGQLRLGVPCGGCHHGRHHYGKWQVGIRQGIRRFGETADSRLDQRHDDETVDWTTLTLELLENISSTSALPRP